MGLGTASGASTVATGRASVFHHDGDAEAPVLWKLALLLSGQVGGNHSLYSGLSVAYQNRVTRAIQIP